LGRLTTPLLDVRAAPREGRDDADPLQVARRLGVVEQFGEREGLVVVQPDDADLDGAALSFSAAGNRAGSNRQEARRRRNVNRRIDGIVASLQCSVFSVQFSVLAHRLHSTTARMGGLKTEN